MLDFVVYGYEKKRVRCDFLGVHGLWKLLQVFDFMAISSNGRAMCNSCTWYEFKSYIVYVDFK